MVILRKTLVILRFAISKNIIHLQTIYEGRLQGSIERDRWLEQGNERVQAQGVFKHQYRIEKNLTKLPLYDIIIKQYIGNLNVHVMG